MDESKLENVLSGRNLLPLHHLHKIGGNTNIKTLNGVNPKTLNGEITKCKITRSQVVERVKAPDSLHSIFQKLTK